ncbi:MAG: alpha-ketoacid dehydrogenase subunit beta [Alphaproteobacteria bacterium]|nr:alpha-ketoacid dehydrogenase subunit beta [Alphaproteobacteria bacterium]
MTKTISYSQGILEAFEYVLSHYPESFILGQGVWSPWYVGNSMQGLDKKFGKERVIDSPVSEGVCTGVGVGASLFGHKPIIVHPRMDFMILAMDSIVNQAAKWSYMFAGQAHPCVTIRSIINRGGEQGAQHSQALHSWFAHIPGLRVVMPYSPKDARDLLIASILCNDPVLYIDDRWLYEQEEYVEDIQEIDLSLQGPKVIRAGEDITIVAASYSCFLGVEVAKLLQTEGISCEVVDLRIINPLDITPVLKSIRKTRKVIVLDGGWKNCGLAGEIIASIVENIEPGLLMSPPKRFTISETPAPTSIELEKIYYPTVTDICDFVRTMF